MHNIHFIVLAESGIVGVAGWVMVIVALLVGFYRLSLLSHGKVIGAFFFFYIMSLLIYGGSDWSPFSRSLFPFFYTLLMIGVGMLDSNRIGSKIAN